MFRQARLASANAAQLPLFEWHCLIQRVLLLTIDRQYWNWFDHHPLSILNRYWTRRRIPSSSSTSLFKLCDDDLKSKPWIVKSDPCVFYLDSIGFPFKIQCVSTHTHTIHSLARQARWCLFSHSSHPIQGGKTKHLLCHFLTDYYHLFDHEPSIVVPPSIWLAAV